MPDETNKLYLLLGEMSSDIKNILKKSTEQDARLTSHSDRITNIERFQWKLMGGATAISVTIGLVSKFI